MSPITLGELPSEQPAPTGLGQLKRGRADAQTLCPIDYSAFSDGLGSPMRISISTGSRPGWWVIRASHIFVIAEAAWNYMAWFVQLEPNDADGYGAHWGYHRLHSALSWQQSCIDGVYRLAANQFYQATMYMGYRSGGNFYYWTGPDYSYIAGEFIGEGSI